MSILQLDRPFLAANRINFEDAEWWTAEDMVKRWILATKLVGKALAVMQTQLMAQECGAFDRFKDDYFMAIAHREAEHPRLAQVRGRVHQHQITG